MKAGRPALRSNLVDQFDADSYTKGRLKILLQTIAGELSVPDACHKLRISQSRFFELRSSMLHGALAGLQPKPAGRPTHKMDPESERIKQLQQENLDLRVHLAAAQLREEIALVMPRHSNRHPAKAKKKQPPSKPATAKPTTTANSFQITSPDSPNSDCSMPGSSDT